VVGEHREARTHPLGYLARREAACGSAATTAGSDVGRSREKHAGGEVREGGGGAMLGWDGGRAQQRGVGGAKLGHGGHGCCSSEARARASAGVSGGVNVESGSACYRLPHDKEREQHRNTRQQWWGRGQRMEDASTFHRACGGQRIGQGGRQFGPDLG
jgi:hypothetical protein